MNAGLEMSKSMEGGLKRIAACEPDDVRPIIDGLVGLAIKASQTGKEIYLWNCL